ncbi:sigma-E processing peptidase SpoIIGA [Gorillibacterium massiliense]|uniref:sigma-E processing peptidase SpoIIGA n=1 Tax=Gorillibacterium massiliense TaxID=1280390 RepID=UPI0004B60130|nr:sigma-E processing peptidase SpoIIGA [Gorillibacterium massiliense]
MVVYIDLLFLANFIVDGALLAVTAWLMKTDMRPLRVAASAGLGALYVVFVYFPELSFLYTLGVKLLFSLAMVFTAFGFGSLQRYLRLLGGFYAVNFAAAGGVFAASYFFLSQSELLDGMLYTQFGGVSTMLLIPVLPATVWLLYRVVQSARNKQHLAGNLADIQVEIGDFVHACRGLIDTGNQLYDPLTRTPVMIVEADQWKDALPPSWMTMIRSSEVDRMVAAMGEDESSDWRDRLRLVPYRGLNRNTQFLLAVKPDRVTLHYNGSSLETGKVLIGLDGGKLSADGSYHAIIHPKLLESVTSVT